MGSQYEVIEEIELLHESFANIMAEIDRVADKKKIDKHSNPMHPLSILYRESKKVFGRLLTKNYSTLQDTEQAWGKYQLIKDVLNDIKNEQT